MNVTKDDARAGEQEVSPQLASELLDGLTEIVSRAAAATLAVPFSQVAQRIKPTLPR